VVKIRRTRQAHDLARIFRRPAIAAMVAIRHQFSRKSAALLEEV